jgi:hypothetical protein
MEDILISYDVALLAKEKGFNLPVSTYSNITEPNKIITVGAFNHNYKAHGNITVSRPTQSLLLKWLRDNHKIHISLWYNTLNDKWRIDYITDFSNDTFLDIDAIPEQETFEGMLDTALLEGLRYIKN